MVDCQGEPPLSLRRPKRAQTTSSQLAEVAPASPTALAR